MAPGGSEPVDIDAPGSSVTDALLEIRDLTVRFDGLVALDSVSVTAHRGEILGVIGPNGAGKTTLFNTICGFVRPTSGAIAWRGESLNRTRPHQLASLGIARTLQGVGLFPGLTALENVMVGTDHRRAARFGSAFFGLPQATRSERQLREASLAALKRLDVGDVALRLPGGLPYGIQKRVALARALVSEPELLLLDEPVGGLGGNDMDDLAELMRDLKDSTAVVLVEHHMDFVMSVCDRVMVVDFGKLIAEGTPDEVQNDPLVLEAYLGYSGADSDEQASDPEATDA